MAWLKNAVNFVKETIDDVKGFWAANAGKYSKAAFDEDVFYDIHNNAGRKNGFIMFDDTKEAMQNELDLKSLRLYNNKYSAGSQEELETAFSHMYDEAFVKRTFEQQMYAAQQGKGLFGSKYSNFDFSDMGKNLTKEQREALMKDFRTDFDERLDDIYRSYVPDNMVLSSSAQLGEKGISKNGPSWIERFEADFVEDAKVVIDDDIVSNTTTTALVPTSTDLVPTGGVPGRPQRGPFNAPDTPLNSYDTNAIGVNTPEIGTQQTPLLGGPANATDPVTQAVELHPKAKDLNFNYGMQKKYIGENVGALDFATSADSVDMRGVNKSINNSKYSQELNAYRSYLNERLMTTPSKSGTWESPDSIYDYFTKKGYDATRVNELTEEYKLISKRLASGNPDHSGLGLWQKAKAHPVIATSIVMGTAFGVSELTEEDDF